MVLGLQKYTEAERWKPGNPDILKYFSSSNDRPLGRRLHRSSASRFRQPPRSRTSATRIPQSRPLRDRESLFAAPRRTNRKRTSRPRNPSPRPAGPRGRRDSAANGTFFISTLPWAPDREVAERKPVRTAPASISFRLRSESDRRVGAHAGRFCYYSVVHHSSLQRNAMQSNPRWRFLKLRVFWFFTPKGLYSISQGREAHPGILAMQSILSYPEGVVQDGACTTPSG